MGCACQRGAQRYSLFYVESGLFSLSLTRPSSECATEHYEISPKQTTNDLEAKRRVERIEQLFAILNLTGLEKDSTYVSDFCT